MARKPKADINDVRKIAEALLKTLGANKKFRDATKSKATAKLRSVGSPRKNDSRFPSSPIKQKINPSKKTEPKVQPPKVKPSDVPSIGESGTRSRKPVKLSTPKRPARDKYAKGKTLAQTASEQRAAERMGNRYLRQSGGMPSKPKSGGKDMPVDVRGSVIKPPTKGGLRQPKPSSSSYEADKLLAQAREDRKLMGSGQKPPRKPRPPKGGAGGVTAKPAPRKPRGSGPAAVAVPRPAKRTNNSGKPVKVVRPYVPNTKEAVKERRAASKVAEQTKLADEIKRIRGRMAEAKTPEKKAKFQQQLNNLVIKTASDRAKGRGKYSNTRPVGNR